jgi:hypothetical protein
MFLELFNTLLLEFFKFFEDYEELNSDCYPENFIEIDGELVKYEI